MPTKAKRRIPAALTKLAVPIDSLRPHPRNPRRGDVGAIAESLERFGQVRPLVAAKDGTVVAGNHTLEAARRLGWEKIAAVKLPLSDQEAVAYLLADNRTADLGRYDGTELAELLRETDADFGLRGTGFTDQNLVSLLKRIAPDAPESFDDVDPELIETEQRCPRCGFEW